MNPTRKNRNPLNKEYHFLDKSLQAICIKSFLISAFFVTFLMLFNQNDNLDYPWRFFAFSGYGFVIFIPYVFSFYLLPKYLLPRLYDNLNLGKYMLWLIITTVIIYILSYVYCYIVIIGKGLCITDCLLFMKQNIMLIFPLMMVILLLDYISSLKNKIHNVAVINNAILDNKKKTVHTGIENKQSYTFRSDNKSEHLVLDKSKIGYINGAENYVEIHYLNTQNQYESKLIRSTLKAVESDESNDFLLRTHRSFLCNLNNVSNVSKSGGNYFLHFGCRENKIPVSPKYSEEVLNALEG